MKVKSRTNTTLKIHHLVWRNHGPIKIKSIKLSFMSYVVVSRQVQMHHKRKMTLYILKRVYQIPVKETKVSTLLEENHLREIHKLQPIIITKCINLLLQMGFLNQHYPEVARCLFLQVHIERQCKHLNLPY